MFVQYSHSVWFLEGRTSILVYQIDEALDKAQKRSTSKLSSKPAGTWSPLVFIHGICNSLRFIYDLLHELLVHKLIH